MKNYKILAMSSVLSLVLIGVPASAAQTIYTSASDFSVAAGGGLSFESFENPETGPTVTYPGFSVTESGGVNVITQTSLNSFFTAATVDGSNSIWYDDNGSSVATFSFLTPISAFGLSTAFAESATASFGGGISGFLSLGANTPGFFGVISDTPFSTVTVNVSGSPQVGFDALSFGIAQTGAVPEPTTWAMMLLGFGFIGGAMRFARRGQKLTVSYA
ncbi:MAG: PEPxxWA-CTERM sorting domain-containing protein [Erythrobacter sp.]